MFCILTCRQSIHSFMSLVSDWPAITAQYALCCLTNFLHFSVCGHPYARGQCYPTHHVFWKRTVDTVTSLY